MKTVAIFIIGFVAGWFALWAAQECTNEAEMACLKANANNWSLCKEETKVVEFFYNVN